MEKKPFLSINIGHVITIAGMIFSIIWFASQQKVIIDNLDKRITSSESNLNEDKKLIQELVVANTINANRNVTFENRFIGLDNRVIALETSMSKISIMGNDMDWMKKSLLDVGADVKRILDDRTRSSNIK